MTVKVYLVSCSSMARSIVVVPSTRATIYNYAKWLTVKTSVEWREGKALDKFMWFFNFRAFCCFMMGSSANGLVTTLQTFPVSGNSEGCKTFCNRCKKRIATSSAEGSHGAQSDKNVNKTDLQSYIYQTSNREASSQSHCLDLTRFISSLAQSSFPDDL